MDSITAALIAAGSSIVVGILTLVGVVITNSKSNRDFQQKLEIAQAVTDTKIENLTTEVREHNNFAKRMPVVEEQIKVINHRLEDVENDIKHYHQN
jgi:lipoate synthase